MHHHSQDSEIRRFAYPPPVTRLERELFQIQDRIFLVNAKESVIQNIEQVVSWYCQHTGPLPGCAGKGG